MGTPHSKSKGAKDNCLPDDSTSTVVCYFLKGKRTSITTLTRGSAANRLAGLTPHLRALQQSHAGLTALLRQERQEAFFLGPGHSAVSVSMPDSNDLATE